jgi:hypothetical protein
MSTFSTYDSTVNSIYLAFYGRPADPAGLKFWSKALTDKNGDASTIIQAFATSDEAQTRFGTDTVSARITDIYEQLFNRAPDAAGLAFWTDAVEQGNATLAEASLAILKGAQSSDLDLSTLRQKAADAFTAAVEDGSTEYSGYASIEAARVLVRAVTLDATEADLANLVKAAVSFADTATKNPKVVEAIATGSTLLNLYDTDRGTKDPVALTQALADTAKAAAGDPVTLESLLRGGGMDKVLKVMPAKATLLDVVEALAKGGLPAAVDVVYPPAKPAPAPSTPMELKFESVSQGPFDTNKTDKVTNVEVATVKFSYTGSGLKSGQSFEYSINGAEWTSKGLSAAKNIVTIEGVDLTGPKMSHSASAGFTIQELAQPVANVFTNIQLRAVDTAKNVVAQQNATIEFDDTPPTGFVEYRGITYGNSCTLTDPVATFEKFFVLDHDVIQWHIEGDSDWIAVDQFDTDGHFTLPGLDLSKQGQKVEVRVIDEAGNFRTPLAVQIAAGQEQAAPTFKVDQIGQTVFISGTATDPVVVNLSGDTVERMGNAPLVYDTGISVVSALGYAGTVMVEGRVLELAAVAPDFAAQGVDAYRIYDSKADIFTGVPGQRVFASEAIEKLLAGAKSVMLSGDLSLEEAGLLYGLDGFDAEVRLSATIDNTPPLVPTVKLVDDIGTNGNMVTSTGAYKVSDLEPGASVQFSKNGIDNWSDEEPFAQEGPNQFFVRQVDAAGNVGVGVKFAFTMTDTQEQPNQPETPSVPTDPSSPGNPGTDVNYATFSNVAEGVKLDTNLSGALVSTFAKGGPAYVYTTDEATVAGPGVSILGAQEDVVSGAIKFDTAQGEFTDNVVYTLGTDDADIAISGQYVWGFDGDDFILGTDGDDFLVGGKGADRIYLGDGGNDTVVIAPGDTASNVVMNSGMVSMAGMDIISNASVGDAIRLGHYFTESRVGSSFMTDGSNGNLALVAGVMSNGMFILDDSGFADAYLLQWFDGQGVHSAVLGSFGPHAPVLEVNIDNGSLTVVGVNDQAPI